MKISLRMLPMFSLFLGLILAGCATGREAPPESRPASPEVLAPAAQQLAADYVSLARPVVLRSSSYNQQLSPGSLLVEVGGHGNTLTEALRGARLFAESASQVFSGMRTG